MLIALGPVYLYSSSGICLGMIIDTRVRDSDVDDLLRGSSKSLSIETRPQDHRQQVVFVLKLFHDYILRIQ